MQNVSAAHLEGAYHWITTAHDAAGDGGVAGWYHLVRGWSASYPETTGYLIPTLFAYAKHVRSPMRHREPGGWRTGRSPCSSLLARCEVGLVSDAPAPAVFNTGQVLFGWLAAYANSAG